ncbi:MAG: DUF5009 domain-containing protein [Pedobacter sp.]|nr:MAG: DUF5009 domain-containing protein [Pedobacter sp.]
MRAGNEIEKSKRLLSLDALRGLAVLLMVLSGSIAFGGVMPAWMYHAQVPPPAHVFNPDLPGITWVDLVFPFFLFSMGAALPLALSRKLDDKGLGWICLQIIKRYILLIFFAIFTYHARAWVMNPSAGVAENLLSMGCFALLFLILSHITFETLKISTARQAIGFVIAVLFLSCYNFKNGGFNLNHSDIIIVVLANMALFGSIIWIITRNKPWLRLGILPIVMAIFLSGKATGSWQHVVYSWSPISWAYDFYYLKYLFIIIPGTFAGEWLVMAGSNKQTAKQSLKALWIGVLAMLMVVLDTYFLFARELALCVFATFFLAVILVYSCKRLDLPKVYQQLAGSGAYLLILGLCYEAFEGGIKKDPSTYSYYFVCTGMAFLVLLSFMIFESSGYLNKPFKYVAMVGQNPMIAYTTGNLFLLPLLRILDFENTLNLLNLNALGGFARGLIFTMVVALVTLFFAKKRVFWKT